MRLLIKQVGRGDTQTAYDAGLLSEWQSKFPQEHRYTDKDQADGNQGFGTSWVIVMYW